MNNKIDSIICGNSLEVLKTLDDNTIALTFTSPPYNLKIDYGKYEDNIPYNQYLDWLKSIFIEVFRVTKNGGRCVVNIDAMTNRQEDRDQEYVRAIYPHLYNIMKEIGWKFRTEICWAKQNAVGRKTAWGSYKSASNPIIRRNHEYILVWTKEDWKLTSPEQSDLEAKEFQKWTFSIWEVKPETRNLGGHPAPFSKELARRVIKLFSFPKDTILDPFSGTGTTCHVAKMNHRHYIGIDIDKDYCKYAADRIQIRGKDLLDNG